MLGAMDEWSKVNYSVIYGGLLQLILLSTLYFYKSEKALDVALSILLVELLILLIRGGWCLFLYRKI
jgi:hypothetical protein